MNKVFDIHMHIVPNIDDGSQSIEESIQILEKAKEQGIRKIIATPHSWAVDGHNDFTMEQYEKISIYAKKLHIDLHLGMEILYGNMDNIIAKLKNGEYYTMAGTRHVLIEFDPHRDKFYDAVNAVEQLVIARYIPIIAHAERYGFSSLENIKKLKKRGAFIQVNLYSFYKEPKTSIRSIAQGLLLNHYIDFVGSDSHRMTHRPPDVIDGVNFVYNNTEKDYANDILFNNADKMIGGM